jgi:hypothetical protein
MSQPGVRFFAYGRFSDDTILACYAMEKKNEASFKTEGTAIMGKIKPLELKADERQKCKTPNGAWFVKVDKNQIISLALCTVDYPERHAYRLIEEAQKEIEQVPNYYQASPDDMSKKAKKWLVDIVKKYDDLKQIDSLYAAQDNVNQITNVMGDNMKKMMDNMTSLDNIDQKSANLKSSAAIFEKQSGEMEKIMYWRLWRMRIILILLFVIVVYFIVR